MKKIQSDISVLSQKGIEPLIQFTLKWKSKTLTTGRVCFFPFGRWGNAKEISSANSENDSVYFFQLHQKGYESFRKNIFPKLSELAQSKKLQAANQLLKQIDGLVINSVRSFEVKVYPSRKNSTAYNPNIGEYLGLHIDSHDGVLNKERSEAWHLVNVNVGNRERYLHFVDLSFKKIVVMLGVEKKKDFQENKIPMHKIVQLFFEKFPNYPVKRIVLPPSYGYIARTQNFIHDGGTNWKGEKDISILISGNFQIKF